MKARANVKQQKNTHTHADGNIMKCGVVREKTFLDYYYYHRQIYRLLSHINLGKSKLNPYVGVLSIMAYHHFIIATIILGHIKVEVSE